MDADDFTWDDRYVDFTLTDARIIAMIEDEPVIVEDGLTLLLSEGRSRSWARQLDGSELSKLEYHFQFVVVGDHEYESSSGQDGVIIITGKHECGALLEVKGEGYYGYDEKGRPEGSYDVPPEIRFLLGQSLPDKLKEAAREAAVDVDELIQAETRKTRH